MGKKQQLAVCIESSVTNIQNLKKDEPSSTNAVRRYMSMLCSWSLDEHTSSNMFRDNGLDVHIKS